MLKTVNALIEKVGFIGNLKASMITHGFQVFPTHVNDEASDGEPPLVVIPEKKIIGGRKMGAGELPYQISINNIRSKRNFCGGSLYNEYAIITAAHCFYGKKVKMEDYELRDYEYVAGEHDTRSEEGEQRRVMSKLIIHPNYVHKSGLNDIAIVLVSQPFKFNNRIQPIPIGYPPIVAENGKFYKVVFTVSIAYVLTSKAVN